MPLIFFERPTQFSNVSFESCALYIFMNKSLVLDFLLTDNLSWTVLDSYLRLYETTILENYLRLF